MANIYVRSTDGSDTDNGTTWALAKATIGGAADSDSTTDRTIMVSDNHAETPSGAIAWAWAGTKALPTIIRCVDDAAEPPTATASTATVVCDDALTISNSGNVVYFEGISFTAGNGASLTKNLVLADGTNGLTSLLNCSLILASTSASSVISLSDGTNSRVILKDVDFKFSASGQAIACSGNGGIDVTWDGGALLSGGTSPTTLVRSMSSGTNILLTGIDLTNAGTGINLFNSTANGVNATVRNCKLPNSWSGVFHSATPGLHSRFSFYNCDASDTNYRLAIHTSFGTIVSETTIVRTGGASDGTTPLSWKMVTNADAEWPLLFLETDEIVRWNETTGSAITVTVELVTDNVTLTDVDIELVVTYFGTSGRPLASFSSSGNTNTLATGTNLTTSSETWTTTGLTTPAKQKLAVTFTPQEKGYIHAVVKLAKASTTVYVDPELTIT